MAILDSVLAFVHVFDGTDEVVSPALLTVDAYQRVEVSASGFALYQNTNATVWVTLGGVSESETPGVVRSDTFAFTNGVAYVGAFSVVVEMEDGVVTSLVTDTVCSEEDNDENCLGVFETVNYDEGLGAEQCQNQDDCDVKVWLSWAGSDTDGDFCISSGATPGRLTRFANVDFRDTLAEAVN